MIERLDLLVDDVMNLNSKLVLLVGPPQSGKSNLLGQLSERRNVEILSIGVAFGRQLLKLPNTLRQLQAASLFSNLANDSANHGLLLVDNIELLFDHTLKLNPLDLLKRNARAHRVVAVWPGELRENRLSYAITGHIEHQDYGIEGLVPFKIQYGETGLDAL